MKQNFLKTNSSDMDWLCDECKVLGYCNLDAIVQKRQKELDKMYKPFKFTDFANLIPLQALNSNFGAYVNNHLQIAYDAFHQEDYETAFLHFKAALEGKSNLSDAYLGLAFSCFKMNDFEMALIYFEQYYSYIFSNQRSVLMEYFITLCEIGLQEMELHKQKKLYHTEEHSNELIGEFFMVSKSI